MLVFFFFRCPKCSSSVAADATKQAAGKVESKGYTCEAHPGCLKTFATVREYEEHYNLRHRHKCNTCKKSLPSAHILELHVLEAHDTLFSLMAEKRPMVCKCNTHIYFFMKPSSDLKTQISYKCFPFVCSWPVSWNHALPCSGRVNNERSIVFWSTNFQSHSSYGSCPMEPNRIGNQGQSQIKRRRANPNPNRKRTWKECKRNLLYRLTRCHPLPMLRRNSQMKQWKLILAPQQLEVLTVLISDPHH